MHEAVERAETRDRVRCATGSCVLSAMARGTTLGGGAVTLGGGMVTLSGGTATLGVGTGRVGGVVEVVATGGTGELGGGVMVGVGIQFVKMSRIFEMAVS